MLARLLFDVVPSLGDHSSHLAAQVSSKTWITVLGYSVCMAGFACALYFQPRGTSFRRRLIAELTTTILVVGIHVALATCAVATWLVHHFPTLKERPWFGMSAVILMFICPILAVIVLRPRVQTQENVDQSSKRADAHDV